MGRSSYRGKRRRRDPRAEAARAAEGLHADTRQLARDYAQRQQLLDAVRTEAGVKVIELVPGDVVNLGPFTATYVQQATHPIWPHLRLVIWKTAPELDLPGDWSHDALDPSQVVGTRKPLTPEQRADNLRAALTPGSPS